MRTTIVIGLVFGLLVGCGSTKPESGKQADTLDSDCKAAVTKLKNTDPSIQRWFDTAHGYAIYPSVGKGGLVVGAAYGRGQVYEKGKHIGYSTIKQGTIGLQAGGQEFAEVIFFKDKQALDAFREGNFELGAQASAVAVKAGASADADYSGGVKVFTLVAGGLMAEATVGGQKFAYESKS
jgi:lipid-binding SYLF domain-containing protein